MKVSIDIEELEALRREVGIWRAVADLVCSHMADLDATNILPEDLQWCLDSLRDVNREAKVQ